MQRGQGGQGDDQRAERGDDLQTVAQGNQFARPGAPANDAVGQAFQIGHPLEGGQRFGPDAGIVQQGFDGILAGDQALEIEQRLAQPAAQQATAHGRDGAIQHAQQATLRLAGADGLRQLQVAARGPVEEHERLGGIGAQGGELLQRIALCFRQVLQDGAGGVDRQGVVFQVKAAQVAHLEVGQHRLAGVAGLEVPVGEGRQVGALRQGDAALGPALREDHLTRGQAGQLLHHADGRLLTVKLRGGKLAGGDINVGQPGPRPVVMLISLRVDGQQVVVAALGQQTRLNHGAGGDHAGDLAGDEAVDRRGADLLADGDVVAFFDQAGYVVLGGMVRDAGHRDALVLGYRAAGQHQVKLTGGDLGVLVERLVKIAQAEEDDRIRELALDVQVLAAHRGDVCLGHRLASALGITTGDGLQSRKAILTCYRRHTNCRVRAGR